MTGQKREETMKAYIELNVRYNFLVTKMSVIPRKKKKEKKDLMHNVELLIINRPEIHRDSETCFETSMLYCLQLLVQKDEIKNAFF